MQVKYQSLQAWLSKKIQATLLRESSEAQEQDDAEEQDGDTASDGDAEPEDEHQRTTPGGFIYDSPEKTTAAEDPSTVKKLLSEAAAMKQDIDMPKKPQEKITK